MRDEEASPAAERPEGMPLWTAALSGCVGFLRCFIEGPGDAHQAYARLVAELALPMGVGFADGRPALLPDRAPRARAVDVERLAARALAGAVDARAPIGAPRWWSLAGDDAGASCRGGWVWRVGGGDDAVALCLIARDQTRLAFVPTAPRIMALFATLAGLARRLCDTNALAEARAEALRREQTRAETLTVELEQAVRTIDSFTALAAHELRTPLSALMLQADSAARLFVKDPIPLERVGHKVFAIGKQVERLRCLVEDLLDTSRLERPHMILRAERVDLAELARDVVVRLEDAFARADTPLTHRIQGPQVGTFDGARVEQVLTNLLSNALKYGMGRPVHLEVRDGGHGACITVADQGIGIPRDLFEHIFSRYGRAVSERDYGGLGLGLWISRQIVASLGGRIDVDSALGIGSTFRVWLPLPP